MALRPVGPTAARSARLPISGARHQPESEGQGGIGKTPENP